MTHTGKIARLPLAIREQLNSRLQNGEPGKKLVAWLNSLLETRQILDTGFGGRPITESNLSIWKTGGYVSWLLERETVAQVRQLPDDARNLSAAADNRLADHLATVLATRYAITLAGWNGDATPKLRRKLRALRELCHAVTELRRGDHAVARLDLARERLDWAQEKNPGKTPDKTPKLSELK